MFSASGKFSGITGSPSRGGAELPGGIRRRKVGMFPASSERGTSRPGRDFFRRKEVAVFSPGRSWGGQADRGKEVSEEAEDVRFRFEGGPSGCPRYRGLSRAEAAKRPCGCRGSADGKKFVVFHDGPPKRKKMVWHVYLFGAVPVVVADRRARPGRCRCCTGYSNRRAKVYFHNKNNKLQNKV